MASGGRFYANVMGYREIMNGPPGIDGCERAARAIAASAAAQSGMTYPIDSMRGINRIHTRVSTDGSVESWFRESHYRALAIAVGSMGGNPSGARGSGYKTLGSRLAASARQAAKGRQTGWRAPSYRKTGRR